MRLCIITANLSYLIWPENDQYCLTDKNIEINGWHEDFNSSAYGESMVPGSAKLHEVAKLINKLGKDALVMSKWLSRRPKDPEEQSAAENAVDSLSASQVSIADAQVLGNEAKVKEWTTTLANESVYNSDLEHKSYEPFSSKDEAFVNKQPKILYVSSNIISEDLTLIGATCPILLELVPMNKQFEQLLKRIHRYGKDVGNRCIPTNVGCASGGYYEKTQTYLAHDKYGIRYNVCVGHPPYLAPEHYYINRLPNRERKRHCDTSHLADDTASISTARRLVLTFTTFHKMPRIMRQGLDKVKELLRSVKGILKEEPDTGQKPDEARRKLAMIRKGPWHDACVTFTSIP
ncbi:hypothetical protein DTO271G3_6786 [Paecilomyces variotii]|nr:hypothetical protein DTO271G3_6786 [Paecilomyces variotii]